MKTNSPLPKIDKQFQPLLNRHILKWFMVLISTQQRGDVVSSGKHMGIAVSPTEHIAAGEFKVYRNNLLLFFNRFIYDLFVQVYKGSGDIAPKTIKRYVG